MLQYNTAKLYKILHDFYVLTKIRIVLIDSEFNELLSYPEERFGFCATIRKNLQVNAKCVTSDRNGCLKCAKTQELVSYRCHAGLTETVVPIQDQSGIMGYVMFGQILNCEDQEATIKRLRQEYTERQFRGISEAIDQIPIKSSSELNAAATVLQALTTYALTNRLVTPSKSEFIEQLDHYIQIHLRENITADDIAQEFQMGRTRLYSVAAKYLGCGLAEYIRTQRIQSAKKLLSDTKMPIANIADATGFSDYNHFSRIFKQTCGISARQYRNESQNIPGHATNYTNP